MTLRIAIVDDEPLARRGMERLLADQPDCQVVAVCKNGEEALQAVERETIDLLLLDIEMPGATAFDVLSQLDGPERPAVVLVTAYDQHALAAFDAGAIDYVLKPVDPERLTEAIDRARRTRFDPTAWETRLNTLLGRSSHPERIVTKIGGRLRVVPVEEIDWIEAADSYVRIQVGGEEVLHRESLSSLAERLDPDCFVRIHRSTLVALDRIRELRPDDRGDAMLVLAGGRSLAVSRRYRKQLEERLSR